MPDHPILFSAPMIRALLEGRKTQTRRIVSPQNFQLLDETGVSFKPSQDMLDAALETARSWQRGWTGMKGRSRIQAGDRLWCRETWAVGTIYDGMKAAAINPGGQPNWCGIRYAATDFRMGIKDRPSIHMPRWASRLTLTVTHVRLQRLQWITKRDALAEGVHFDQGFDGYTVDSGTHYHPDDPRQSYKSLWNAINGDEGPKSWDANPWVLAYRFAVRHGNIDMEGSDA